MIRDVYSNLKSALYSIQNACIEDLENRRLRSLRLAIKSPTRNVSLSPQNVFVQPSIGVSCSQTSCVQMQKALSMRTVWIQIPWSEQGDQTQLLFTKRNPALNVLYRNTLSVCTHVCCAAVYNAKLLLWLIQVTNYQSKCPVYRCLLGYTGLDQPKIQHTLAHDWAKVQA